MRLLQLFSATILLSALFSTLLGCQSQPIKHTASKPLNSLELPHAYSRIIIDSQSNRPVDIATLASQLQTLDVIFIGEYHGNHASHLLQMQLQSELFNLRPEQILSMEMFERHQQAILNRYLDGEIGEKYLINETPTWPNYAGSYRPMIEFAKEHFLPVIAANAPGDIVRCIGQYGQNYIDLLPAGEKGNLAQTPFMSNEAYQSKFEEFMNSMRHGQMDDNRKANSYAAQLARDNTMAESILQALQDNPNSQVIHLNGRFHSASGLGTVALLKQRAPELKIAVITPIRIDNPQNPKWNEDDLSQGDYIYLLRSQPEEYIDASYRRKAMKSMFDTAKQKAKTCYPSPKHL